MGLHGLVLPAGDKAVLAPPPQEQIAQLEPRSPTGEPQALKGLLMATVPRSPLTHRKLGSGDLGRSGTFPTSCTSCAGKALESQQTAWLSTICPLGTPGQLPPG